MAWRGSIQASMAVLLVTNDDGIHAAGLAALAAALDDLGEGLPPMTLLNINVPAGVPKGVRVTRLGHRVYSGKIVEQADPRGRPHYWIGAGPPAWDALDGTDMGAVHEGYAAVTPLHLDLTHHRALAQMTEWEPALNAALRARPRGERAPASAAAPSNAASRPSAAPPAQPKRTRKRRRA